MGTTPQGRIYGWGTQTNYQTPKTLAANALRKMILTDKNFIDLTPVTKDDADWSHGFNTATEQWKESFNTKISHQMPGYLEEMIRVMKLGLGTYSPSTPSGGTTSKAHLLSPLDVNTTRQLQAFTYFEKLSAAHDILAPSCLIDGFTLKGNDLGLLTLDFGIEGSGKLIQPSNVNTGTHIVTPTNLHKLFNTQVALSVNDGTTNTIYGCKYRAFTLAVKNTFLDAAAYKPGCDQFQTSGDKTSGAIKSELLLDKQEMTFDFTVDMEADSGELAAVISQKPIAITLVITDGTIIEGTIPRSLSASMYKTAYTQRKVGESNGLATFEISAKILTDVSNGKSLEILGVNDVATYATW